MLPTTRLSTASLLKLQPQEILTHERNIDLPGILRSSEPSVLRLRMGEDYMALLQFATMCTRRYLECCFPAQTSIAATFASDLIDTRPTWKAADFINLFRFFRQRQDIDALKVFGNTITHTKLMEMTTVYELERCKEMERMVEEKKGDHAYASQRSYSETSVRSEFGRIAEAIAAKQEEKRMKGFVRKDIRVAPDEVYFREEHGVG